MNNLFTLKSGLICFSLLVCQLALKAQSTPATKSDTSFAVKADTALSVKAGSTMVIRADTTLVINADTAAMRRLEAALAKKADAMRSTDKNIPAVKAADTSTSIAKTAAVAPPVGNASPAVVPPPAISAVPVVTPPDSSAAAVVVPAGKSTTTIAPPTDGIIEVRNTATAPPKDGVIEVKNAAGEMQVQDSATASAVKTDSTSSVKKPDDSANKDAGTTLGKDAATVATSKDGSAPVVGTDASAKKADASPIASTDSSVAKKADTTAVKKDTTLAKKDTALVKRSDTTIVQKDSTKADSTIKAQNVYLEVGGPGLAISANYDTRFKKERNGWGYRVGLGYFASGGNNVLTVPFQINYLIGEHSHMLELGAGTTFLNSNGTNVGNSKFEFDKVTGFIATATLGYRFQPLHKGINVRVAFVPILYDEGIIAAGGISVGYTFK